MLKNSDTTNDPAILRKGRFDRVVVMVVRSLEEAGALLGVLLKGLPIAPDLDITRTASLLEGRPLSDASFLVREDGRLAAKAGKSEIDGSSFEEATRCFKEKSEGKKRLIGF